MSKKPCRTCGGRAGTNSAPGIAELHRARAQQAADLHGKPVKVGVTGLSTPITEKEARQMQAEGFSVVWPTEKEQARPDVVAQRDTENVPSEGDTADPESAPTRKRRTNSGAENESEQQ